MSLGPPPPRRSRRERLRLPSSRLGVALGAIALVIGGIAAWQLRPGAGRTQWTAAPAVPAKPSAQERAWLARLSGWISFVRDAREDPGNLAVRECGNRLERLEPAPSRLREVRALARDTCAAATAQAIDRRGSQISWDPGRAGKANDEERETSHDLALLLRSLNLRAPPGGAVVAEYSRIAQRLSGGVATVRCWDSAANWQAVSRELGRTEQSVPNLLGFAVYAQRRVELSPEVCASLTAVRAGKRPLRLRDVEAIEVLTHESVHLVGPDGISNEAKVDCIAAQRMHITARALDVRSSDFVHAPELYLRVLQRLLPAQYRSPKCRSGGAYDLTPGDGRWP